MKNQGSARATWIPALDPGADFVDVRMRCEAINSSVFEKKGPCHDISFISRFQR